MCEGGRSPHELRRNRPRRLLSCPPRPGRRTAATAAGGRTATARTAAKGERGMAETGTTRRGAAWAGWVTFAGVLLAVLGALNILEGLVALLRRQVTFIDGDSLVVVNLTGLGVVMIVFGALLAAAGIGLITRSRVARIAAIVIVSLHALVQIGS